MEMNCIRSCALLIIIFGSFYLSEGKACPERVRPHKTRCEMYYKCMELQTQRHVWIPEKCEKGLVFENDLKMCVLPGDDWECMLGEQVSDTSVSKYEFKKQQTHQQILNKDSDIYVVSNGNDDAKFSTDDGTVEVILQSNDVSSEEENESDQKNIAESSGDGADFEDNFLNVANRETFDDMPDERDEKIEHFDISNSTPPTTTNVDPNLTVQLQRLSQLIDGLKQTYQNRDKEQAELGPDQLNAFLAHFNIRNKFDFINTEEMHGNYKPATIVQNSFNNKTNAEKQTLMDGETNQTVPVPYEGDFLNKLKPETKVVLTSNVPKRYSSNGYSNSQIVVNRPEGSVLFSLPPYSSDGHFVEHTNTHTVQQYEHNVPKISEETLKTVLELSKQMIANQNVPNVISNPAYYAQPIIQPLFLPPYAPRPSSVHSPFSSYYGNSNVNNAQYDDHTNDGYQNPSMHSFHKPHFVNKKPHKQGGTTIIHNNVIPVHVTSTNSGEKEVVDSYGQSLGLYPPLTDVGPSKNGGYTFQMTHQYENNKFVTTVRPYVSTTPAGLYSSAQYEPPYGPTDYAATTVRPPLQFQPTPATIAEYYTPTPHLSENNVNSLFGQPQRYPSMQYNNNLPRPIDPNRPDAPNSQYQQVERPSSYQSTNNNSPYPPQIDANKVQIRPNSEKIESMETDDDMNLNDPSAFNGYGGSIKQQKPQNDAPAYGQSASFLNQASPLSGYSGNNIQNPYMPRPTQSNFGQGIHNRPKFPNYEGSQLVNIGGNFISYDAFQNNILPLIGGQTGTSTSNIEVITCQTGIRQPNITDCTRYYVCSKKDGKVLSYSCPPYTAFNSQTRICDARSYANCSPDAIISSYTVSENKRIQMEAIQAINEAKRRQEEALNAQKLTNIMQQYNSQLRPQFINNPLQNIPNELDGSSNVNMLNTYMQQAAMSAISASTTTPKPSKKRKYYCKEGDKVPDQTSIYNYFVCYKNGEGVMKGKKMTCLKGLLFCPAITSCTLPAKCR